MLGFVEVAGRESLAGLFLKFVNAGEKLKRDLFNGVDK